MQKTGHNPDVNSREIDADPGASESATQGRGGSGVEKPRDDEVIPVPPEQQPIVPIQDPPGANDPPVGDVDDSPEIIAEEN